MGAGVSRAKWWAGGPADLKKIVTPRIGFGSV